MVSFYSVFFFWNLFAVLFFPTAGQLLLFGGGTKPPVVLHALCRWQGDRMHRS
jgi:hypothetical protein